MERTKVKVGNIHRDATSALLRSFFEFHGNILRTQYATLTPRSHAPRAQRRLSRARERDPPPLTHDTSPLGRIKGTPEMRCGFVEFSDGSAASSALLFDRSSFVGKPIGFEPCDGGVSSHPIYQSFEPRPHQVSRSPLSCATSR